MQPSRAQAEQLVRSGAEALRRGDHRSARDCFEQAAASDQVGAQIHYFLAFACRGAGDAAAAEAAVDRLLERDPKHLRGLMLKGDLRTEGGDSRAAISFYTRALQIGGETQSLPADMQAELKRAQDAIARTSREYKEFLEAYLEDNGFGRSERRSARFQESLDIMFGEKPIYYQQPTTYYFPQLPQIQFYDREQFDWLAPIEAGAAEMRDEILAVLEQEGAFAPYMVQSPDRPRYDFHGMADNPSWSTFYLWENGGPVEENVERCPRTFDLVRQAPLPHISVRAPSILFSLLRPGARIPAHNGMLNARLICHLPLIVPPDCGFRVGNETRQWEVGKTLIFDDTIEHEAWNDSQANRVVLIFDIWRPELSEEERRLVTAIFEAVDAYDAPR